ncbi:MAG TPA: hypothetical protein VKA68_18915 [bacterium]|nr:hypothetical protein [bacterium]
MATVDYDKIGKLFWFIICVSLTIILFIYFLNEHPVHILTAFIPIGMYVLIPKVRRKQQRKVHYYPRTIVDFALTTFSFFIVVVMFTWYIEGYYYIQAAFFIMLFLVSIFSAVSYISHLWRNL